MQISVETAIGVGTILSSIAGSWFVSKWRMDHYEKDAEKHATDDKNEFSNIWEEIGKVRDWQIDHKEDSVKARLDFQKQIGEIHVVNAKTDEKFSAIITMLEEIRKDVSRLKDAR